MATKTDLVGAWRIHHTNLWDPRDLDLVEPARITLKRGGKGDLVMCAVHATIDWTMRGQHLEFSFQGFDDGTEVTGRGYGQLQDSNQLAGRILRSRNQHALSVRQE